MASPSPAEIQYQLQHIHDDTSSQIIAAFGVCLGFAIIAVLLRFVARHLTKASLGGDDWTILVGLLLAIGYIVGESIGIAYGLGKHVVLVTNPVALARAINASVVCYISSLSATKISILLLYRRIFPKRGFHAVLWGVGTFVLAFTIANVLVVIFQCHPVKAGFNPLIKAKCIDDNASIFAIAILTTTTDFIILILPLPLVWKLQLPKIRKVQVSGIFLLGLFTSAVSVYRASVVKNFSQEDLSYDSTKRAIWSGVEICTAIVCANLATLRPLLKYGKTRLTAYSGSASKDSTSSSGKSFRQRWTWRSLATSSDRSGTDGRFQRLGPSPGVHSIDDLERQKYETHLMSPLNSPHTPETAHFR